MSEIFQNILTKIGQEKKALAESGGTALNITFFKVGDGNGAYYEPTDTQTNLVNPKYTGTFVSGSASQIIINPAAQNEVLYKCFIPADIGGFTVRELGLFDSNNDLILICKLPAQDKFALESGLYQPLTFTPKMIFSNPNTQVVLSPTSQITATQTFVTQQITQEMSDHITDPDAHKSLFEQKAQKIGCETQTFKVANAVENQDAVPKGQLNSLIIPDVTVPYSVNSGTADANGYANFISKVDNSTVKILATTTPIVLTYSDGSQETISADVNIDSLVNGTYIIIKTKELNSIAVKTGYSSNTSLIPILTSNSGTDWTVTTSSETTGAEGFRAFDGVIGVGTGGSDWTTVQNLPAASLKITKNSGSFTTKKVALSATTGTWNWAPGTVVIKDQNGNILHTVTGLTWTAGETKEIELPNIFTGTTLEFECINTTNTYHIQLAEIKIFEYFSGGTISESAMAPISPLDGDYWLNIGVKPYQPYKRMNGSWIPTQFVKLGEVTIKNGTMETPISYAFNGFTIIQKPLVANQGKYMLPHCIGSTKLTLYGYFNNITGTGDGTNLPNGSGGYIIGGGTERYNGLYDYSTLVNIDKNNCKLHGGLNYLWMGTCGVTGSGVGFTGADAEIYARRVF